MTEIEQESGGLNESNAYNDAMIDYNQFSNDYARIEQVIYYIEMNASHQPSLKEIADHIHLSEYHLQRLFTRWVGISPKRFLQFITKQHARKLLADSRSILETTQLIGLSSPGRLHDLFITWEAVTPGEFKLRGKGLTIRYGFHQSPFGEILLGATAHGICNLSFVMPQGRDFALDTLQEDWPLAKLVEETIPAQHIIDRISFPSIQTTVNPLHIYMSGSNFQLKVWEALLYIPPGNVVSYRDIAGVLGEPDASRAVGNAIARNPIAVLIPCHRVIHSLGDFGHYHYGAERKVALLGWEMAKVAMMGS